jgi:hypothetical protein
MGPGLGRPDVKLARPDIFHPRIALAGCAQMIQGDGDDAGLVAALRGRGLHARWLSWDDPDVLRADLVILRATRDYVDRLDEFLAWTTKVSHLLNAPDVVAWNADRGYLFELDRRGVAVVPSEMLAPGDAVRLPSAPVLVVKPGVGAGSFGARRFTDQPAARAYVGELHEQGRSALVQTSDGRADREGQTALVFLGGRRSHAFRALSRRAMDRAMDVERPAPADPDFEVWDVGVAALDAAAEHLCIDTGELLYARVDIVGGHDDPRVAELELVEPSLGWRQLDPQTRSLAQREFVLRVESALERLGLGPFSHRRP